MVAKFIKRIGIIFVVVVAILFVFRCLYIVQLGKIRIDKKTHILVCGDSHTQCALNDSILKHSLNVSNSGEVYINTYNKIKILKNDNPQIDTIILAYGFHSLSGGTDNFLTKEIWTRTGFPTYVPILDNSSLLDVLSQNTVGVLKASPNIFQEMLNSMLDSKYSFMGYYNNTGHSVLNEHEMEVTLNRHYYKEKNVEQGFSPLAEKYLRAIVQYCNDKHVKLILLNTPITEEYYNRIPDKFVKHYYAIANELKQNATLIDMHSFKLENKMFGDADHVNEYGATVFTEKIDSLINNSR